MNSGQLIALPELHSNNMGTLLITILFSCLLANVKLSESKGKATFSVLLPKNDFFIRQFTSVLGSSIKQVSTGKAYKTLTSNYTVVGTIDFASGKGKVTKALCDRLVKSGPSTFLYMPYNKTAPMKKYVLKKISEQKIPVILWDRTGTASEKWKGSSGLVLHLAPTVEQMAQAGVDLTKRFGWNKLAVIHDTSSGAEEFISELKKKSPDVLKYKMGASVKKLKNALFRIITGRVKAVFLFLQDERRAAWVFKVASTMHMTGKSTAWILSNLAIPKGGKTPKEFPIGIFGLEVKDKFQDSPKAIKTAVTIWARGLEDLVKKKPQSSTDMFQSKGTCSKPATFSSGYEIYREMFVHGSADSKGGVQFVGGGASNEKIRIINLNKGRWLQIGEWSSTEGLDIFSIIGPGGVKIPPCSGK